MGGVSVLHPQYLFNHYSNPMISPALRSQYLRRWPTSAIAHTPNNNTPHKSSSSSSNRMKRWPLKKNPSPLKDKEPSHNIHIPKPRYTPKPKTKPATSNSNNNHHLTLVMGQVKLLKRGEPVPLGGGAPPPLPLPSNKDDDQEEDVDLTPKKPQPLQEHKANHVAGGKKKEKEKEKAILLSPADLKRIHFSGCYAGSAFVSSPPPSSLPVPAFIKKKNLVLVDAKTNAGSIDEATSDLLRLLRLDL